MKSYSTPKKIAVINDIAGYGRCSLTVALPVISAMKVQACPVPTSYFSNHMGFSSYFSKDLSEYLNDYLLQWESLNLLFDGIYCGYLSDSKQITILTSFLQFQKSRTSHECKILIDPVMGDRGKPYKSVTPGFCEEMKNFLKHADILTPNLTEACILTDTPYKPIMQEYELLQIAKRLEEIGAKKIVITGIYCDHSNTKSKLLKNGIGNYIYESESSHILIYGEVCGNSRPGTGDLFASILSADAILDVDFTTSVKKAADFVRICTKASHNLNIPVEQGVCFENFLQLLT